MLYLTYHPHTYPSPFLCFLSHQDEVLHSHSRHCRLRGPIYFGLAAIWLRLFFTYGDELGVPVSHGNGEFGVSFLNGDLHGDPYGGLDVNELGLFVTYGDELEVFFTYGDELGLLFTNVNGLGVPINEGSSGLRLSGLHAELHVDLHVNELG